MDYKSCILISFLISSLSLFSQYDKKGGLGFHFDHLGNFLFHESNGYYAEDKMILKVDPSRQFVKGCYSKTTNDTVCGFIKLKRNSLTFSFKSKMSAKEIKVNKRKISAYSVLGYEGTVERTKESDERTFREFGAYRFTEETIYTSNGPKFNYYVYQNDEMLSSNLENRLNGPLLSKKQIGTRLSGMLAEYSFTNQLILKNRMINIPNISYLYHLEYLFKNNTSIYLNNSLKENSEYFHFKMNIDSLNNDLFYTSIYDLDDVKRYEVNLTVKRSSGSIVRHGLMSLYNQKGNLIVERFYNYGKIDSVKTYHSNGQLFQTILIQKGKYLNVYDSLGNKSLDSLGNGKVTYYDRVLHRNINFDFEEFNLNQAYFNGVKGNKTYLFSDNLPEFKFFESSSMKVEKQLSKVKVKYGEYLNEGYTFFEFEIDPKGITNSIELIEGKNPIMDKEILEVLRKFFISKSHFTDQKRSKEKLVHSILIPTYLYINKSAFQNNSHWTDGIGPALLAQPNMYFPQPFNSPY